MIIRLGEFVKETKKGEGRNNCIRLGVSTILTESRNYCFSISEIKEIEESGEISNNFKSFF